MGPEYSEVGALKRETPRAIKEKHMNREPLHPVACWASGAVSVEYVCLCLGTSAVLCCVQAQGRVCNWGHKGKQGRPGWTCRQLHLMTAL